MKLMISVFLGILAITHAKPIEDPVLLKGPSGIVTSRGPIGPTGPARGGWDDGDDGIGLGLGGGIGLGLDGGIGLGDGLGLGRGVGIGGDLGWDGGLRVIYKDILVPETRLVARPVLRKDVVDVAVPVKIGKGWGY